LKLKGDRGEKTQFEKLQNRLLVECRIRGREHLLWSKYKNEDVPADISPSELTFQECRMAINVTAVASPFSAFLDGVTVSSSSTPAQYIPVQFVPQESVSKEDKLFLSFWGSLLGKKFGRLPAFGRIFHGENFRSMKVNLHQLIPKAGHVMEKIVALSESNDGPALLINKNCQTCEFAVACRLTAVESDDLSLLPSLKPNDIVKLNNRGIFTVTQYSCTFRPRRKRKRPEHYRNPHRPELKAFAIRENKVYVHGTPELPKPKVDIFVDVEGIPDSRYYYLIGLLIVDRGFHREHSLWANGPDEQLDIFRSFLNLVSGYEDYTIYHYGRYERDYLKRMAKNLGNKTAETTKNIMDRCCNPRV
jgi:predicted RecB family nuclease